MRKCKNSEPKNSIVKELRKKILTQSRKVAKKNKKQNFTP